MFYTVYGDEEARASTAAALESAKGVLRSEVGKQTGVKFTPTLEFIPDAIPETAAHLEELLKAAAEADAAVHEQAATRHVRRRRRSLPAPGRTRPRTTERRRPTPACSSSTSRVA